jgi:hypothetical protein
MLPSITEWRDRVDSEGEYRLKNYEPENRPDENTNGLAEILRSLIRG